MANREVDRPSLSETGVDSITLRSRAAAFAKQAADETLPRRREILEAAAQTLLTLADIAEGRRVEALLT